MPFSREIQEENFIAPAADGVFVSLYACPGASQTAIRGVVAQPGLGAPALKVSITTPPEKGRANTDLIAFLARSWNLPKSLFFLESGAKNRRKRIKITGEPACLLSHILKTLPQ